MLTEEENRTFAAVGPGTLMGELMRRYWMPVAAETEMDDTPIKPVRVMGEDLTLYKDKSGNYGLVDRHCPHRRADMSYGFVEDCGLRCSYHGWLFDESGRCLQQPFEDIAHPEARFKDRVHIKAYPVEAKAGLLWAYLGPAPAPLVPTWEPFTWPNGFVQIVMTEIPCNWFQCQENSIDPVHVEWQHSNWTQYLKGLEGPRTPTHLRVGFDEFEYGFQYRRILEAAPSRTSCGPWAACACGRTPSLPAPTSSGASLWTTALPSAWAGSTTACPARWSPTSRTASRTGTARSRTPRRVAGSPATS